MIRVVNKITGLVIECADHSNLCINGSYVGPDNLDSQWQVIYDDEHGELPEIEYPDKSTSNVPICDIDNYVLQNLEIQVGFRTSPDDRELMKMTWRLAGRLLRETESVVTVLRSES